MQGGLPGAHPSARHICVTGDSLQNLRIRVVPGPGLVAVQGEILLVVPSIGTGQEPALEALLAVAGSASLERAVARVVADFDDDQVPPFCLVAPGEVSGLFALVHGELELSAEGSEGGARLRGREARTWVDRLLPGGLTRLAVTTPDDIDPAADPYVDLKSGVVRGAGVLITRRDEPASGETPTAPTTESVEAKQGDTPERDTPNSAATVSAGGTPPADGATGAPDAVSSPAPSPEPSVGSSPEPDPAPGAPSSPVPSAAAPEPTASWAGLGRDPGARPGGFRPEPIRFGQGGRMESMTARAVNGHDGTTHEGHGRRAAATATAEPAATVSSIASGADEEITVVDLTAVEAAEAGQAAEVEVAEAAEAAAGTGSVVEAPQAADTLVVADTLADAEADAEADRDGDLETDVEDEAPAEGLADPGALVAAGHAPAETDTEPASDLADADRQEVAPERSTSPLSTSAASAALAASAAVALEHAREQARLRARELAAGASSRDRDRDRDAPEPPTVKTVLDGRSAPPDAAVSSETLVPSERGSDPDDVPFYARTQIVPPPSAGRNLGVVPPPPAALDPFGAPAPKPPVAPDGLLAEPPAPRPMAGRLVIENAPDVVVDRDCVIGRNPEVDPDVAQGRARAVTLPDAEQRISRVHARLLLTDRGVDIIDAGSVNGTWIEPPGAVGWIAMVPRVPAPLPLGSRIQVGDLVLAYEAALPA